MPVGAAVATHAAARAAGAGKLQPVHAAVVIAGLAAAAAILWAGVRASPGGGVKVAAAASEDKTPFTPPPGQPVVGPEQIIGGTVWVPHRYPRVPGLEITALINYGHATLRLPHSRDTAWITRPPSEETL